jgi:YVTN family beta-propeller protein
MHLRRASCLTLALLMLTIQVGARSPGEAGTADLGTWSHPTQAQSNDFGAKVPGLESSGPDRLPTSQPAQIPSGHLIGTVVSTLDLANNTLHSGVYYPETCSSFSAILYSAATAQILSTCQFANALTILNGSSGSPVNYLPVGGEPVGLTINPQTNFAYVANQDSGNVSVISLRTQSVVGSVAVNGSPDNLTVDPQAGEVFVSDSTARAITVFSTTNDSVLASISLGSNSDPISVEFDQTNNQVYVADQGLGQVDELSPTNFSILNRISVVGEPTFVAANPFNGNVYVGIYIPTAISSKVAILSGATGQFLANVTVGFDPDAIAFDSSNGTAYVANGGTNNVTVINGTTLHSVPGFGVGDYPVGEAFDPVNHELLVTDQLSGNIAVVNTSTGAELTVYSLNPGPEALAVAPEGQSVYVSNSLADSLMTVNTSSMDVQDAAYLGGSLRGVAVTGQPSQVYVACESCATVFHLNTSTGALGAISVGEQPTGIGFDPVNGLAYTTNSLSDNVSAIDVTDDKVVDTISIGSVALGSGGPDSVAIGTSTDTVYVASEGNVNTVPGNVSIISGSNGQFEGSYNFWAGPGPSALCLDPQTEQLLVADSVANTLVIINTTSGSLAGRIPVGESPDAVGWDPLNGFVYVANAGSANVTVVNGTTDQVLGSIPVSYGPTGIAVDDETGRIYVTDGGSGALSVIGEIFSPDVEFESENLSAGATWWVNVSGEPSLHSQSGTIAVTLPEGDFSYLIGVTNKSLAANPGDFDLSGENLTVPVVFKPVLFTVNLTESGLPIGTRWWANASDGQGISSITTGGALELQNGTFALSFGTTDKIYEADVGQVTVKGRSTGTTVLFYPVESQVTFIESGLPQASSWIVWLNLTNESTASNNITFDEVNGTYTFAIQSSGPYTPEPSHGLIVVAGGAVEVRITFGSSGSASGSNLVDLVGGAGLLLAALAFFVSNRLRKRTHPALAY